MVFKTLVACLLCGFFLAFSTLASKVSAYYLGTVPVKSLPTALKRLQ